jgi:hypothetical protein
MAVFLLVDALLGWCDLKLLKIGSMFVAAKLTVDRWRWSVMLVIEGAFRLRAVTQTHAQNAQDDTQDRADQDG